MLHGRLALASLLCQLPSLLRLACGDTSRTALCWLAERGSSMLTGLPSAHGVCEYTRPSGPQR